MLQKYLSIGNLMLSPDANPGVTILPATCLRRSPYSSQDYGAPQATG